MKQLEIHFTDGTFKTVDIGHLEIDHFCLNELTTKELKIGIGTSSDIPTDATRIILDETDNP